MQTINSRKMSFKSHNDCGEAKTNSKSVGSSQTDIEHIIVIGNTGLGKSSLVKLLTKNIEIKTANTAAACTTETQPYPLTITDKDNNSVVHSLIYDTQGTQDTKMLIKILLIRIWQKILVVKKIVKF